MKAITLTIVATILVILYFPFVAKSQGANRQLLVNNLCKKWAVDSVEINDTHEKFPAPENIKDNYTDFKKDGTFEGQDDRIVIKGKWKFDFEKMQIINYDINNAELKGEIIFTIVELNEKRLAITSNPMSGNQITMYYKPVAH